MKTYQLFLLFSLLGTIACSSVQKVRRNDGGVEYIISCGNVTGWDVCYKKAQELCPIGYKKVYEDAGSRHKELRVDCLLQNQYPR